MMVVVVVMVLVLVIVMMIVVQVVAIVVVMMVVMVVQYRHSVGSVSNVSRVVVRLRLVRGPAPPLHLQATQAWSGCPMSVRINEVVTLMVPACDTSWSGGWAVRRSNTLTVR